MLDRRVEALVRGLYDAVFSNIGFDSLREEENLFVRALTGREGNVYARLERSLVTMLGSYAPRFFQVFFTNVSQLKPPFDFEGELRGKVYQVKVVTGDRAFNSTLRDRVSMESFKYPNPIILTLQGRNFQPQLIGKAPWYSAYESWNFVTGEPWAYRQFRDIVFEVAREYRSRIISLVSTAVKR